MPVRNNLQFEFDASTISNQEKENQHFMYVNLNNKLKFTINWERGYFPFFRPSSNM